jgi:hypothetical protein
MADLEDDYIGTIDAWQLHQFKAPIQRIFVRHDVDQLELNHYVRDLLATGQWDAIHFEPVRDDDGHLSDHVYELHGHRRAPITSASSRRIASRRPASRLAPSGPSPS